MRNSPSTAELTLYSMMADLHIPPSELGIDMHDIRNIFRFSKVHRFMKNQESLTMKQKPLEDTNPNHYTRSEEELREMFK